MSLPTAKTDPTNKLLYYMGAVCPQTPEDIYNEMIEKRYQLVINILIK